jgi:hypothetical protein
MKWCSLKLKTKVTSKSHTMNEINKTMKTKTKKLRAPSE